MRFNSKVDWWVYLIFGLMVTANIWLFIMFVSQGGIVFSVSAAILLISNVFLIIPIWLNTYYVLDETELMVKCGIGRGTRIAYSSIENVKESKSLLASSALSLDRIEISFGVGGVIFVSPKNKQEFLLQLEQRRNLYKHIGESVQRHYYSSNQNSH